MNFKRCGRKFSWPSIGTTQAFFFSGGTEGKNQSGQPMLQLRFDPEHFKNINIERYPYSDLPSYSVQKWMKINDDKSTLNKEIKKNTYLK
jgi:hypothetical protein